MDPGWYVVLTALALSGLARLIAGGFHRRRIQQELASRRRAPIGKASGTGLCVTGRVQALGNFLTAPVSGRRCVAFQLRVDEWNMQNHVGRWSPILDLQDARSFALADETGEALVDTGTPIVLALALDEEGGTERPDPIDSARLGTVITLLGPAFKTWSGKRRVLRYGEGVLNEGDLVSVAGSGTREPNPRAMSPNLRDPAVWLMLRGTDEEPLWISNAPDFGPVGDD